MPPNLKPPPPPPLKVRVVVLITSCIIVGGFGGFCLAMIFKFLAQILS